MYPEQTFLETAVRALVSQPEAVKVERTVDELGVLLTLSVAAADMATIVGRAGQTVKSLRALVRVVGSKHDLKVNLKVLEPDGSNFRVREPAARPAAAATPPAEEGADAASAFA